MIEIVDRFQIQTKIKVFYYYDYRAGRDYIAKNMIQLLIVYIVIIFQAKRNSRSLFMQID